MFLFLLGLLTGFVEQQFNKPRMGLCVAVAAKDVRHLKSLERIRADQSGGITLSEKRSNGLDAPAIRFVATCV
jgi:hypothetical protein